MKCHNFSPFIADQSSSSSTPNVQPSTLLGLTKSKARSVAAGQKGVEAVREIKAEKQVCQVCNEQIDGDPLILPCKHAFHPHHLIDRREFHILN